MIAGVGDSMGWVPPEVNASRGGCYKRWVAAGDGWHQGMGGIRGWVVAKLTASRNGGKQGMGASRRWVSAGDGR